MELNPDPTVLSALERRLAEIRGATDEEDEGWWPPSKRALLWFAGGAVVLGGLVFWAVRAAEGVEEENDFVARGRPVCPVDPAPSAGLRRGDYVILVLADRARLFRETAWGQVLSRAPEGDRFLVRLLGKTGAKGVVDLARKKHGFQVGDEIHVDAACIWDTMHAPDVGGKGQLYCGFEGKALIGEPVISTDGLEVGDEVKVVVSTLIGSEAHADELWVKVDGISRTGNVIYGTISSPVHFPIHGFRRWQKIEFARDCVFGWREP